MDSWRIEIGSDGCPALEGAQRMHAEVYQTLGFLLASQTVDHRGIVVDKWSDMAVHFALYRGSDPVGHLRVIPRSGEVLLPVEHLQPSVEIPETTREVSFLAVGGEHAIGLESAKMLYKEAFYHSYDAGCTHWVGIVELPLLRILTRVFKFPFKTTGSEMVYGDAITVPALMKLEDAVEAQRSGVISGWFAR